MKKSLIDSIKDIVQSDSLINKKKNKEDAKRIKEIKKKIKQIKTMQEFESVVLELEEQDLVDAKYFEKLKKKKKKKLEKQSFDDRLRVDENTINRLIMLGKSYKQKERQKEYEELIQTREERQKNGGVKDKEREKDKSRDERTRGSGGRTRGGR